MVLGISAPCLKCRHWAEQIRSALARCLPAQARALCSGARRARGDGTRTSCGSWDDGNDVRRRIRAERLEQPLSNPVLKHATHASEGQVLLLIVDSAVRWPETRSALEAL